jgi:CRISPR-associated endonuclease Csn1
MPELPDNYTVLGLDVGVNSVGWALVRFEKEQPKELVAIGSHVFEPGMDGDIQSGREESRNLPRRAARQIRRQLERRTRRQTKLANCLQRFGLLPGGDMNTATSRHNVFEQWDREWFQANRTTFDDEQRHVVANTLPYHLRAKALTQSLAPYELGRALYHLGQRRGFLSNRKNARDDDDEKGKVYGGISDLRDEMEAKNKQTLGTLFSSIDPTLPDGKRIRGRYTDRQMYLDEFEQIWEAQRAHHPALLTDETRASIHRAIFFQRKLKSSKKLVGLCTYERRDRGCPADRRRAPIALLECQRFRMWQNVNNLRYRDANDEMQSLTDKQRRDLFDDLDRKGTLSWTQVRVVCGLPKKTPFNLEEGGEKTLRGNTTAAKLIEVFGDAWHDLRDDEQRQVVEDIRSFEKVEALQRRATNRWDLNEEQVKEFCKVSFEADYMSLSRQAIEILTPYLERGNRTDEAILAVYGQVVDKDSYDKLPPVVKAFPQELRNPTVIRSLTQVRKLVNTIIKEHGKPDMVRVELARDVKKSKKQRQSIAKRMREREGERKKAKDAIGGEPSARDIEKYLLWEECNHECPYTGKTISMAQLFGDSSQFDVEHIIPYSRSLDDSFTNKTLCYHEENRNRKRNLTPREAYSDEELSAILQRVKRFKGDFHLRDAKMERFRMSPEEVSELLGGFTTADLNNTRYANKLAASYCKLLYGDETTRVQVCNGSVTAQLRNLWGLNGILGDGGLKTRDDHRHHAVDAVAIALCSPGMVRAVSRDAIEAERKIAEAGTRRKRLNAYISLPWDGFFMDVRDAVLAVNTSISVDKRVRGALHEAKLYSSPRFDEKKKQYSVIRKPIDSLSDGDVRNIVDPVVREIISSELRHGNGLAKEVFKDRVSHPFMKGGKVRIHKVRVKVIQTTFKIGNAASERNVILKNNHHSEIIEIKDRRGNVRWDDIIVTQFEAHQRKKLGLPIIQREHEVDSTFVMSFQVGEIFSIDNTDGSSDIYRLRSISKGDYEFCRINDARLKGDMKKDKDAGLAPRVLNTLRVRNCRKVILTRLGEVRQISE